MPLVSDYNSAKKSTGDRYSPPAFFDPTALGTLEGLERVRLEAARMGDAKLTKAAQIVIAYATGERCGNAEFSSPRHWPSGSADALDLVILTAMIPGARLQGAT